MVTRPRAALTIEIETREEPVVVVVFAIFTQDSIHLQILLKHRDRQCKLPLMSVGYINLQLMLVQLYDFINLSDEVKTEIWSSEN